MAIAPRLLDLPEELVELVLGFLPLNSLLSSAAPTCAQVQRHVAARSKQVLALRDRPFGFGRRELLEEAEVRLDERDLCASDVDRLSAALLAGAFPWIEDLHLGSNPRLGEAGTFALASAARRGALSSLCLLDLGGCSIGDAGAIELVSTGRAGAFPKLRVLDLSSNSLSEAFASALAAAVCVISPAEITPAESRPESPTRRAAGASLPPGDGPCAALAAHRAAHRAAPACFAALRRLDLRLNSLGDGGAIALADALAAASAPALPALRWLQLSRNGVGVRGAHALATALERSPHAALPALVAMHLEGLAADELGLDAAAPHAGHAVVTLVPIRPCDCVLPACRGRGRLASMEIAERFDLERRGGKHVRSRRVIKFTRDDLRSLRTMTMG